MGGGAFWANAGHWQLPGVWQVRVGPSSRPGREGSGPDHSGLVGRTWDSTPRGSETIGEACAEQGCDLIHVSKGLLC